VIGLLVATDYQGIARRLFSLPSEGPREKTRQLRKLGRGVLGDERTFLDIGRRYFPDLVLGAGFMAMGALAFVVGLIGLAISLSSLTFPWRYLPRRPDQ
jgi:hypothetical protein